MKRRERLIPKFQSSFTATSGTTFMLLRKPIRDITITRQSVLATVVVIRDAPERKDTSPADSRHRAQPTGAKTRIYRRCAKTRAVVVAKQRCRATGGTTNARRCDC